MKIIFPAMFHNSSKKIFFVQIFRGFKDELLAIVSFVFIFLWGEDCIAKEKKLIENASIVKGWFPYETAEAAGFLRSLRQRL